MSLTLTQQYDIAMRAVTRGDIDLLSKVMTDPDTVNTTEQRTVAEGLGIKRGLLAAFVNIIADPTVWIAALMSRAFPTSAWIRGTIPKRYIGAQNEFTGISAVTRPVEDFFRGTTIPRLVSLKMRREAEVMKASMPMFEPFARPNWREEMPIVSLLLEGQNPTGATPELRSVAKSMRNSLEEMWGFLKHSKKIQGGFGDGQLTPSRAVDFKPHEAPRHLRDYLPHIPLTGDASIIEIGGAEALRRMGRRGFSQALKLRGVRLEEVWTINQSDRLASDFSRFQAFMTNVGHRINPRLFQRHRTGIPLMSDLGQELWVTDLNVILPKYAHSVARTFANNAPLSTWERQLTTQHVVDDITGVIESKMPSADPIITQIINEGIKASGGIVSRRPIVGTKHMQDVIVPGSINMPSLSALNRLVRSVQGTASDDEILFGNLFNTVGRKLDRFKANMTRTQVNETDAAIRAFERNASYRRKTNGLASHFYATTLGLNPWSAIQNLLQPILTTAPAIGIGPTIAGYKVLRKRLPIYAREFVREHKALGGNRMLGVTDRVNAALERSFYKTFPELAEQGIKIDPRLFDIDESLLTGPAGVLGSKYLKNMDAFNKLVLQPFTHAEMSNQVVTFYGAKEALRNAIRTGEYATGQLARLAPKKLDDLLNFDAGLAVNATQFRPGPGTRTILQSMLPAPLRMFTSFPIRAANFFTHSTIRGAMTNAQLQQASVFELLAGGEKGRLALQKVASLGTGRNVGTLARTFIFGRIATEGFRQVADVDLSGALGLTAPFNVAPSGQPFAPMPFPPIASVTWGIISAATNRDMKRLQPLVIPGIGAIPIPKTLIPGGVGISRAIRAVQQFRPDVGGFVDDDERLMYRGNTTDLVLSMLGIPLDKNRRVRDAMERTQAVRSRVRDFRRQFAVAKGNYDMAGMSRLRGQYAKKFPDMPPLDVSNRDMLRYQENARIPMVQRQLRTLGEKGRFLEEDIYEHDPDLLADVSMN